MKKQLFFVLGSVALFFSACTKENKTGPQAQVKLINGSVNTATAKIYFDDALLIGPTGFTGASGYAFVNVGTPTIKIEATSSNSNTYLITGSSSFSSNINYTLVLADSAHKLKTSVVTDDISATGSGKAKIRFFNLIGNSGLISVDTSITTAGTTLFGSRSFNDQSTSTSAASFITVNAATYKFAAKDVSTATAIALFNKNITLEEGKIYTIIANGAIGGTSTSAPSFTVIIHN